MFQVCGRGSRVRAGAPAQAVGGPWGEGAQGSKAPGLQVRWIRDTRSRPAGTLQPGRGRTALEGGGGGTGWAGGGGGGGLTTPRMRRTGREGRGVGEAGGGQSPRSKRKRCASAAPAAPPRQREANELAGPAPDDAGPAPWRRAAGSPNPPGYLATRGRLPAGPPP